MTRRLLLPLTALATALTGCCSMARLFCGPDQTPWVHESFATPAATIATFKEALRRDDAAVVSRALSQAFKERMRLPGAMEARLALDYLNTQAPVHMVGYAEVGEAEVLPDGRHRYLLDVEGHRVHLVLVRQAFWELQFQSGDDIDAEPKDPGEFVTPEAIRRMVKIDYDELEGDSRLEIRLPPAYTNDELDLEHLRRASIGFEWFVDDFAAVAEG